MTNKELQEKYLQIQFLEQQLAQLQQQISIVEQQIMDFKQVENSLDNLSKTKKNTKLLSSLGLGIFLETRLENNKEVLMNVGSRVVVKKPIQEAKRVLKNQTEDLKETLKKLQEQLNQNIQLITSLTKEIETSNSKLKKK